MAAWRNISEINIPLKIQAALGWYDRLFSLSADIMFHYVHSWIFMRWCWSWLSPPEKFSLSGDPPPAVLCPAVLLPGYLCGGCSHGDVLALLSAPGMGLAGMLLAGLARWLSYPKGEGGWEVLYREPAEKEWCWGGQQDRGSLCCHFCNHLHGKAWCSSRVLEWDWRASALHLDYTSGSLCVLEQFALTFPTVKSRK